MADGFDPCECMWDQDAAMQRLVSLLRSSQSYCTDNECFMDGQNLPTGQTQESNGMPLLLICCWLLLSLALYFLQPASRESPEDQKSRNNYQDPRPPNPPSAIS